MASGCSLFVAVILVAQQDTQMRGVVALGLAAAFALWGVVSPCLARWLCRSHAHAVAAAERQEALRQLPPSLELSEDAETMADEDL